MPRYFLFYKPYQVLCQFSPEGEKRTLAHFFPALPKNIYSVGRLDYDSEGLLILTDDKLLTARLLDPSFAHVRTYYVQVEGEVTEEAIKKLSAGVLINVDGKQYKTRPAMVSILKEEPHLPARVPPIRFRKNVPTSWLSLTITEGKNRQVRKMTAAVNFPTLRLVRYSIGTTDIDGMQPGEYREMSGEVVPQLLKKMK